eukprot:TRINITY_DN12163_c0_g1_i2.p1 TRINITY_DN12163_c0_g1~~TRINITY_DN12163_c0_g1_i2.p1  ORF type:complete len:187 (-),score=11.39 TRINITY_DN12163_c0_g1_i2:74-634(-)
MRTRPPPLYLRAAHRPMRAPVEITSLAPSIHGCGCANAASQDHVNPTIVLNVVLGQCAGILQLLGTPDEPLLIWRNPFPVLDHELEIRDGLRREREHRQYLVTQCFDADFKTPFPPVVPRGLVVSPRLCGICHQDFSPYSALILSLIHISEPTRLLSISYAVFCLKKKKKKPLRVNKDIIREQKIT